MKIFSTKAALVAASLTAGALSKPSAASEPQGVRQ